MYLVCQSGQYTKSCCNLIWQNLERLLFLEGGQTIYASISSLSVMPKQVRLHIVARMEAWAKLPKYGKLPHLELWLLAPTPSLTSVVCLWNFIYSVL